MTMNHLPMRAACTLLFALGTASCQSTVVTGAGDLESMFASLLPPTAESLWTLVPWRPSLTAALAEAKRTGKPVYLYVNDGDIDSGRG